MKKESPKKPQLSPLEILASAVGFLSVALFAFPNIQCREVVIGELGFLTETRCEYEFFPPERLPFAGIGIGIALILLLLRRR